MLYLVQNPKSIKLSKTQIYLLRLVVIVVDFPTANVIGSFQIDTDQRSIYAGFTVSNTRGYSAVCLITALDDYSDDIRL